MPYRMCGIRGMEDGKGGVVEKGIVARRLRYSNLYLLGSLTVKFSC